MKMRRVALLVGSAAVGAILVWLLVRVGHVDLRTMWRQVEEVKLTDFLNLTALSALLVGISTMKWRTVDTTLRRGSDAVPSRITAFSMSSVGMALGLVLPVALGMTAARTAGTHAYGRTLKRGTAGTLFEQSFDLLVILLLGVVSTITWFCHGGGAMWTICAVAALAAGVAAARPAIWLFRRIVKWVSKRTQGRVGKWIVRRREGFLGRALQGFLEIEDSRLLKEGLVRKLLLLSAARFAVNVLIVCQTAEMIGVRIEMWRMAAALPFAAISNLLAITPGAVGLNELTSVAALHLFGTPLELASQWALANRILATGACFAVTALALLALGVQKLLASGGTVLKKTERESVHSSLR